MNLFLVNSLWRFTPCADTLILEYEYECHVSVQINAHYSAAQVITLELI